MENYYSVPSFASAVNRTRQRIYQLINRGVVKTVSIGGYTMISNSEFKKWTLKAEEDHGFNRIFPRKTSEKKKK